MTGCVGDKLLFLRYKGGEALSSIMTGGREKLFHHFLGSSHSECTEGIESWWGLTFHPEDLLQTGITT